jgi:hypothetical protein
MWQVFREGGQIIGYAEWSCEEDMKRAIRELDNSEFLMSVQRAYIRVREGTRADALSHAYGRDRGRTPRRSLSPGPPLSRYKHTRTNLRRMEGLASGPIPLDPLSGILPHDHGFL